MAVQWTEEQQKVISLRNANVLVSAAAGSGKTAVLVQRILAKIMDEEHPINIDQLVIVTFTQAAAGEMRERIQSAIEKEAALHPENEHLQRQRTRIHMANISTIHSFCKNVIQNHFQEIDLEPSFRIGDEGELKLMKKEVLGNVLEEYYEEGLEEFYRFTETFSAGKSDDRIEEIILQLYHSAMSYPYPRRWLAECVECYQVEDYGALMQTEWMQMLFVYLSNMLEYIHEKLLHLEELIEGIPEKEHYQEVFEYYGQKLKELQKEQDYRTWYEGLANFTHPALPRGKKSCQDAAIREEIKSTRDDIKGILNKIKETYFRRDSEALLRQMSDCRPVIETLVQVTERFMEKFKDEKRQKNLLDFNDLEHEALRILRDDAGNPTETAMEYGQFFDEILIDEYQDSNLVQEYLLTSISKLPFDQNNIFMVGDAKQSIYRFRLARPELFMEKFNTYSLEEGSSRRIDLHKNFRSRHEVLDSANFIFGRIMRQSLGGIAYDETAALYPGMEFMELSREGDYTTELLLFDKQDRELVIDPVQYEAKIIAHRIKKLVSDRDGILVLDKNSGEYRKAKYRDIAILLRSTNGFDSTLVEELAAEGIPAHTQSREGYFDALEIATVLNYLRIIDNPLQDIPLLSVLKSPIVGLNDEEVAKLRIFNEEDCIYRCVTGYTVNGEEEQIRNKLSEFLEQLIQFRKEMCYMPIHKFICRILDVTGYGEYIGMMPGGAQRKANMEMLVEKASAFEETSYLGVFQFISYIEQLQKYEIDMGEASVISENDDTVRIMTIHKSKGLEFPIVFVAGLGRKFNKMESRQALVVHPKLGLGMEHVCLETRQKDKMLLRSAILLQNQLESMGEELRVLYVALTRAREKLILTGGAENLEKHIRKAYLEREGGSVSYGCLALAECYLDWILAALAFHKDMSCMVEKYIEDPKPSRGNALFADSSFEVIEISLLDAVEEDLQEMAEEERIELEFDMKKNMDDEELPKEIKEVLEFLYPYEDEKKIPAKISVSELKRAGLAVENEGKQLFEETPDKIIPDFMQDKGAEISAVNRGSAYHKVFECLDLTYADNLDQIKEQMEQLYLKGILKEEMRKVLNPSKLLHFAQSGVGKRMKKAQEEGFLYKEQPFVYALSARELDKTIASSELVMIQGIIDAFFEEEGELILLDYKTDYVTDGNGQMLTERYKLQMEYYKKALEAITGKPVRESIIYSVFLEKEIYV